MLKSVNAGSMWGKIWKWTSASPSFHLCHSPVVFFHSLSLSLCLYGVKGVKRVLWGGGSDRRRSYRPGETPSILHPGTSGSRCRWGPMRPADNFCLSVSVWCTSLPPLNKCLWLVFRFVCCAIGLSLQCLFFKTEHFRVHIGGRCYK